MYGNKGIARLLYRVFTVFMACVFALGVFSFATVPQKARAEAEEIEEMLRKKQEEEEERIRRAQEELLRQQKEEYDDCILFYRLGDFYEIFFDDAILVSKLCELVLTSKACGNNEKAPMRIFA